MNFARQSGGRAPVPPEKGAFPLDHEGECKALIAQYLRCLKTHEYESQGCTHLSKDYLRCRMERGLMVEEDFSNLGFKDEMPPVSNTAGEK